MNNTLTDSSPARSVTATNGELLVKIIGRHAPLAGKHVSRLGINNF